MTFKLGTKYEDFKAPWEKDGGEIDPEKAKRLLFNALESEATATDKVKTVAAEKSEVDKALEVYKEAETKAARAKESDEERHAREKKELEDQLEKAKAGGGRETLLLEIALEKNLTKAQAKRLVGETREELEKDADDYLKDIKPAAAEETDDDGNPIVKDDISLERQPKIVKTPAQRRETGADMGKYLEERKAVNTLIA